MSDSPLGWVVLLVMHGPFHAPESLRPGERKLAGGTHAGDRVGFPATSRASLVLRHVGSRAHRRSGKRWESETGATFGRTIPSRAVCRLWVAIHSLSPRVVGGCHPLRLQAFTAPDWKILHGEVVCTFGICTEVLVAE